MTTEEIKMLIDSKQIPDDIALQLARELLQCKRELAAIERVYAPVKNKAFYYIYCEVSNRTDAVLRTGICDHPYAKVRERNDIVEIGKRLDAQFQRNAEKKVKSL